MIFPQYLCPSMDLERNRQSSWKKNTQENEPIFPFTEAQRYENRLVDREAHLRLLKVRNSCKGNQLLNKDHRYLSVVS